MDTNGQLNNLRNDRGVAAVYIALMLVVLLAFVGLAVDLGFMYVAKGQLQNAADSAALAGAARLPRNPGTSEITAFDNLSAARREAWRFALTNNAAMKSVFLVQSSSHNSPPTNLNNSNDPDGDIIAGNWSRTNGFRPRPGAPLPSGTAINAVKVVARRSSDDPISQVKIGSNPISIFFGKVMGWDKMDAAAEAVAACPARATTYLAVCQDFCSNPPGTEIVLQTGPEGVAPSTNLFAWSSLLINPTSPGFSLNDLICSTSPSDDVCGSSIYSTMGADTVTLRNMESVMYDPNIDRKNKDINASGDVTGWKVLVPYTTVCPPGATGSWDPKTVSGYATAHIRAICATGVGSPCRPYSAPNSVCKDYPNNVIVFDSFTCVDCAHSNGIQGLKPVLVQ